MCNNHEDFNRRGVSHLKVLPPKYDSSSVSHPIYVPSVVPRQEPMPDAITLMNRKSRYYLEQEPIANEILSDGVSVSVSGSRQSNSKFIAAGSGDTESIDLGVVQLRRIIEQIRGLKSNSKLSTFNPNASQAAGLPSYSEYLHGFNTIEMNMAQILKEINQSKSQNIFDGL